MLFIICSDIYMYTFGIIDKIFLLNLVLCFVSPNVTYEKMYTNK